MPRVLYQGLLRSPASWARVGRGYVKALLELGVDLAVVSARGFGFAPDFSVPPAPELTPDEAQREGAPIGVGFLHPPLLDRLIGEFKANLFVCEAERVPKAWVEGFARKLDLVLAPSRFTLEALVRSGLPPEQVACVPYGHGLSAAVLAPEAERHQQRPFTFLAVVNPHHRKGVRELLRAYGAAFTRRDDVRLRVKSTYDPAASRRRQPFEMGPWSEVLAEAGLGVPGAPRCDVEIGTLSDDEVAALYGTVDVCVQPSWGESFGLAILDALAAGRPALVTGWGGHMDFVPPGPDVLPYILKEAGDSLYERCDGASAAIVDIDALGSRMRWHYENPDASRRGGLEAQRAVAHLTWANAARQLLETLEARAGK